MAPLPLPAGDTASTWESVIPIWYKDSSYSSIMGKVMLVWKRVVLQGMNQRSPCECVWTFLVSFALFEDICINMASDATVSLRQKPHAVFLSSPKAISFGRIKSPDASPQELRMLNSWKLTRYLSPDDRWSYILMLFFPFQTHTLNVQARYEMNRTRRTAELAALREHSYSKLNVAWTDVFYICSENFLYLVL